MLKMFRKGNALSKAIMAELNVNIAAVTFAVIINITSYQGSKNTVNQNGYKC